MFKGLPGDQLHQFIASSRATIPQLSLSFPQPLHGSSNTFPNFDPYSTTSSSSAPSHHHHQQQQVAFQASNIFLHPFHQAPPPPSSKGHHHHEGEEKLFENSSSNNNSHMVGINLEVIEREREPIVEPKDPWSSDEVLALLRIRSSMENWFPDFTWEHVSRKLADLGFKRSPDKCKEKFEEESRYFNNISNNNFNKNNNYRVFGELEELYNEGDGDNNNEAEEEEGVAENNDKIMDQPSHQEVIKQQGVEEEDKVGQDESRNNNRREVEDKAGGEEEQDTINIGRDQVVEETKGKRKRKRSSSSAGKRFEMFVGFCEGVVQNMLAKQEEMHAKLLEDMVRRDEEKAAREEEWKRQEMDRIDKELELRAHEQVLASDRQATIIKFLNRFTQSSLTCGSHPAEVPGGRRSQDPVLDDDQVALSPMATSSSILAQNPSNPTYQTYHNNQKPSPQASNDHLQVDAPQLPMAKVLPNPNLQIEPVASGAVHRKAATPSNDKEDIGKRWPRDEVLALINLRCSLFSTSNNDPQEDKEQGGGGGGVKGPLWERISKGMMELGYKRSAKRCKEKWENINKYFRKTKDLNKKRSVDSRTCPYFHQLNALYTQGALISPTEGPTRAMEESP